MTLPLRCCEYKWAVKFARQAILLNSRMDQNESERGSYQCCDLHGGYRTRLLLLRTGSKTVLFPVSRFLSLRPI